MKYTLVSLSVVILFLSMTQATLADDVNPPIWRGQESTTSQVWEFNYDSDPNSYERYYAPDRPAPGGLPPLPDTHATVFPGDPEWMPIDDIHNSGRIGIWGLSGWIDVFVNNYDDPNEFKWVWVQLTWASDVVGETPSPTFINMAPAADLAWPVTLTDQIDWGDGWFTSTYQWRIYPNPVDEVFTISYFDANNRAAIIVDQLVIDTWCVPEPATLGLFLVGGLALLRRRRA